MDIKLNLAAIRYKNLHPDAEWDGFRHIFQDIDEDYARMIFDTPTVALEVTMSYKRRAQQFSDAIMLEFNTKLLEQNLKNSY